MNNNYYNKIGSILHDVLASDEDPFATENKEKGRYRKTQIDIERRPPPKINKEQKRIPVPPELIEDFAILNVLPGVPLEDCKKAWKHLLKKHHPDLANTENEKIEANKIIYRINNSFRKIDMWFKEGRILTEKELNS